MPDLDRLVDILAATAEVCGTEIKPAALVLMAQDLSCYPLEQVEPALTRVRRELKGKLTLSAVLERISDGRPEPDEAWGMCLPADDEEETVVWTREMAEAFGVARPILEAGDKVGARMAFKAAYDRLVSEARASFAKPVWEVSLGYDSSCRERALMAAVERGLLTGQQVQQYLPRKATEAETAIAGLLTGKVLETSDKSFNSRLAELRQMLKESQEATERERAEKVEARIAADRAQKEAVTRAVEEWKRKQA